MTAPKNKVEKIERYKVYKKPNVYYTFTDKDEAEAYADTIRAIDIQHVTLYRATRYTPKRNIAGLLQKPKNAMKPKLDELYDIQYFDFKTKTEAEACANSKRYDLFTKPKSEVKNGAND